MPLIRYSLTAPTDEVYVPHVGKTVKRGETIEVDEGAAQIFCMQPIWELVADEKPASKPAAKKKAAKAVDAPIESPESPTESPKES